MDKLQMLLESQASIRENGGRDMLSDDARDVFDAVDWLCSALLESRKDVASLRARLAEVEADLHSCRGALGVAQTAEERTMVELRGVERERDEARAHAADLTREYDEVTERRAELQAEVARLRGIVAGKCEECCPAMNSKPQKGPGDE